MLLSTVALAACGSATPSLSRTVSKWAGLFVAHQSVPATIHIDFAEGTYSGVIAGKPVNGSWGPGAAASAARLCPGSAEIPASGFAWSGTFAGKSYKIDGCQSAGSAADPLPRFVVTGTFDGEKISAHATFDIKGATISSLSVPFSGSVGPESLAGSATARWGPGGTQPEITARFTVG